MREIRMHAGRPRIAFSTNLEKVRVAGEWIDQEQVAPLNVVEKKRYSSAYKLGRSLPGWPLVDGINMGPGGFVPMEHQLTPMDILANKWLPQIRFGGSDGLKRTRLILADEGGHWQDPFCILIGALYDGKKPQYRSRNYPSTTTVARSLV